MESAARVLPPNPRENANFLSVLCFAWVVPFFKKGFKKNLQLEDVYRVLERDRSESMGDQLEINWNKQLYTPKGPSLIRAVCKTFWPEYVKLACIYFAHDVVFRVAQPLLLGRLLLYFREDKTITYREAVIYATGILTVNIMSSISLSHLYVMGLRSGMNIRVALCTLVYRKALRLSQAALGQISTGKLVNLLSNDVSRFDQISSSLNVMWVAPMLTIIITFLVWNELQWPGLIGIGIIIIFVPLQSYSGKLSSKFRLQTALRTDERIRFMDEIIQGIQVIKLYAWEIPFAKIIARARKLELNIIRRNSYVRAIYMTCMLITTRMAIFSTMVSIALLYGSHQIAAAKIFSVTVYFNVLSFATMLFVRGLAEIGEALVAIRRLKHFFILDEKKVDFIETSDEGFVNLACVTDDIEPSEIISDTVDISISMQNAAADWNEALWDTSDSDEKSRPTLNNVNVSLPKGKLIGIVGPVGSGKTSLLHAFLHELPLQSGSIKINGTISYASQEPWTFAASVRQNILFGQEFDRERYDAVVECCALTKDFEQLENGDLTLIGDRGASMSGGQKARVNLARAAYRNADIYLFDDPLSSVDAHVGTHIFEQCIGPKSRLAQKNATRILVTHQVHFLREADWIIIFRHGEIEAQGAPGDLASIGIDFATVEEQTESEGSEENLAEPKASTSTKPTKTKSKNSKSKKKKPKVDDEEVDAGFQMEASSKGKVAGSILWKYFRSGTNIIGFIFIVAVFLIVQLLASMADFWVSIWTRQEEMRVLNQKNLTMLGVPYPTKLLSTNFCIEVHAILLATLFVFAIVRAICFFTSCIKASQHLHDTMFTGIISTSMQFFNTNPSGRILNRFSKDIGAIDEPLPKATLDTIQMMLVIIASLIVTAIVHPIFLVPTFVLGVAFTFLRRIYLKTSKNIKRLEGITKSLVFTHLATTLNGLSTVRAYNAEKILRNEFDNHQDTHSACWYMFIATNGAFSFSLDLLCFVFIAFVIYFCVFLNAGLNGAKVGLAITQTISIMGVLQWGVRQSAEVSNQMTSVERVLEYQQLEPEEEPSEPKKLSEEWPTKGCIEFKNVFYRYFAEADPVLRNLTFIIKPKEKIGIVGRTGAGKSSLIGSLFRLAIIDGEIIIDCVDTSTIKLSDLRSRIAIIPQDPVLFSGTLRRNLDPFEEYSDDEIWRVLEQVELRNAVSSSMGLLTAVSARGKNFSVGQRQLLCLARAILRKNRILVLDEATANVDPQTDSLIQRTIRERFAECTVLTIAHRLHTVMDSDRILVMDNGRAIEFDQPYKLLKKENGIFAGMLKASGSTEFKRLTEMASDRYRSDFDGYIEEMYL